MNVLIGCEQSGIVRETFRNFGANAYSCDLKPSRGQHHLQMDIFNAITLRAWDVLVCFPPCTYVCKAQLWRCNRAAARKQKQTEAIEFVKKLMAAPIEKIAIENPIGILGKAIRKHDQLIYPYQFGDPYQKDICLWLKNLPKLSAAYYPISPGRRRVANHVNSRMSQAQKSEIKSSWHYFPKTARAMAEQWLR